MKPSLIVLLMPPLGSTALASDAAQASATPFAGTLYQSIAAIIVFLLLLTVLRRYAWGPILKGLQEREGKIKADLERTEQANRQAQATLAEYRAQLAAAHAEGRQIIEQGRADAEKLADGLKSQTQAEIEQMKSLLDPTHGQPSPPVQH